MKLNLKVEWIRELKASGVANDFKWASSDQWRDVDIERLESSELMLLLQLMEKHRDVHGSVAVTQKIKTFLKLQQNPGRVRISRLEALAVAIKKLMEPTSHKWLFTENEDGHLIPWYVYNIEYEQANQRNGNPAHTAVSLAAIKRKAKTTRSLVFHAQDLGDTANELLRHKGFFVETTKIIGEYIEDNKRYQAICALTGEQFMSVGRAYTSDEWYSKELVEMEREGEPTRVVMDDVHEEDTKREEESRKAITSVFWTEDKKRRNDDGGEQAEKSVVQLPLQPYVKVFDLDRHAFCTVHVGNLTEYAYDATVIDKLILPHDKKELVSMLVMGADVSLEDIVRGKTGGIIVFCTGPPGTGKTLTAEVFSEQIKRPLYTVQCSQLGTDERKLEEKLRVVLSRSQRWKAILLIDEADVYVHERGDNIGQNAVVGVFLRILEYYRGVLFMTSNRETIIDDAIMSRATAWIQYDVPNQAQAVDIWHVLSTQYKAGLDSDSINALAAAEEFQSISGRSIKNLLKLAKLLSARKGTGITVDMIKYVAKFLDLKPAEKRG